MSKQKKFNAKKSPRRPRPRPASRWTDPARTVVVGVVTKCASTCALVLIAHIASRR